MINTYQTSAFPPPIPPRSFQQAAPLVPRRGSRAAVRVLGVVVVLHLLLTFGGFFFLYTGGKIASLESANPNIEGEMSGRTSKLQSGQASHTAMASMTVKRPSADATNKAALQYLQWNIEHSILKNVGYYWASWLRVKQPGHYYVYAKVSFSRGGGPDLSLVSMVRLKHDETAETQDVMKAYCSMGKVTTGQCTASQGQVMHLQAGNLLGLWVEHHTWVDYERGATTFGVYKL